MKQHKKKTLKNIIISKREEYLDFEEQLHLQSEKSLRDMKYMELIEVLNKDLESLE